MLRHNTCIITSLQTDCSLTHLHANSLDTVKDVIRFNLNVRNIKMSLVELGFFSLVLTLFIERVRSLIYRAQPRNR